MNLSHAAAVVLAHLFRWRLDALGRGADALDDGARARGPDRAWHCAKAHHHDSSRLLITLARDDDGDDGDEGYSPNRRENLLSLLGQRSTCCTPVDRSWQGSNLTICTCARQIGRCSSQRDPAARSLRRACTAHASAAAGARARRGGGGAHPALHECAGRHRAGVRRVK